MEYAPNLKAKKYFEGKISVREFLVDFFGALMPGVFFLILIIPALIIPISLCIQSIVYILTRNNYSLWFFITPDEISVIKKIPVVFDIAFVLLFLAFGYIIGMLFYRIDPKKADYKSYMKIRKELASDVKNKRKTEDEAKKEMDNWVVANKEKPKEKDVQYPYNNLGGYLKSRGWNDLVDKIPWDMASETGTVDKRSKTFINSLKIRLQFYCPEQCSTILKNEAHIRLSSSLWFVSNSLIKFSSIGFLSILLCCSSLWIYSVEMLKLNLLGFLLSVSICTVIYLLSRKIKSSIEKFLHYQRVREIFYVLDTAMVASEMFSEDEIFGGGEIGE